MQFGLSVSLRHLHPFLLDKLATSAILLCCCKLGSAVNLWRTYRDAMSEDFHHQEGSNRDVQPDPYIYGLALADLQKIVLQMGGKELTSHGLPPPPAEAEIRPREVLRELD